MIECVWAHTGALTDEAYQEGLEKMPSCIGSRIERLRNQGDRKASLAGKLLIYSMLAAENAASLMSSWQFGKYNKPYIPGWRHFNISHSGEIVIVAIGDIPLGVDIERIVCLDDISITEFLHLEERDSLAVSFTPIADFYRLWVRKESFLKAIGMGLNKDLRSFNCLFDRLKWMGNTWCIIDVSIHSDYRAAICCMAEEVTVNTRRFDFLT